MQLDAEIFLTTFVKKGTSLVPRGRGTFFTQLCHNLSSDISFTLAKPLGVRN